MAAVQKGLTQNDILKCLQGLPITTIIKDKGVNAIEPNTTFTLLHIACVGAHVHLVRELLQSGANVNKKFNEHSPLTMAMIDIPELENDTDIKKELDNIRKKISESDKLFRVHKKNREDIVKELIKSGADINIVGTSGLQPIHIASFGKYNNILKLLLTYKVDINAQTIGGMTPLHFACQQGDVETVQFLLSKNPKINIQNRRGNTAFDIANNRTPPDQKMIQLLREAGAISSAEMPPQPSIRDPRAAEEEDRPLAHPPSTPRAAEEVPPQAPHVVHPSPDLVILTPEEAERGHHCARCELLATHKCPCGTAIYCGEVHQQEDWPFHIYVCMDPTVARVFAPNLDGGKRKRYRKKTTRKKYKSKRKSTNRQRVF
jgi:ankyrin repeat protein